MTRSLLLLIALSLAACSGISGVEYSKVSAQPVPNNKTVSLNVAVPEGETDRQWRTARRKVRSNLNVHLLGTQTFQNVTKDNQPADYRLNVTLSDVALGPAASDAPETGNALANIIAKATTAYNDGQKPDQVRGISAYVTLLDAKGGQEVMAFTTSGRAGSTDGTVSSIVSRIVAGLQCYGEDCV